MDLAFLLLGIGILCSVLTAGGAVVAIALRMQARLHARSQSHLTRRYLRRQAYRR